MLEDIIMWLAGLLATVSMMAVVGLYKMIKDTRTELTKHQLHVAETYPSKNEVEKGIKTCMESLTKDISNVKEKVNGCDTKLDKLLEMELNRRK